MKLTSKFDLDDCNNKKSYSIKHREIPISLSKELTEAIFYLLWYVPNIKSEQSYQNELLLNPQYDDYIFLEIMKSMDLRDEDVLFCEEIPEYIIDSFKNEICTDRQKLVMSISNGETKTMSVLRHIRNAIAHGNFNVVENMVLGFDLIRNEKSSIEYNGFFKIVPQYLLDALKKIQFDFNSQKLISEAFRNTGYKIEPYQEKYQRSHIFELFARKNGKKYAIDIKNYTYQNKVSEKFVHEIIEQFEGLFEGIIPILIINTSFLTEESKEELLYHDVIILDTKNIKKMISGRDMVSEIERAQQVKRNIDKEL